MQRPFQMIDVFCDGPFTGNPVAVLDGEGLHTEEMQQITRWLNLSETTFLLPPTQPHADYRVRIFTLQRELPFAGHPTLGTCHAWAERSGSSKSEIVQECGAGLISVRRRTGGWAFGAPPLIRSGLIDTALRAEVAEFLKISEDQIVAAEWCDNGPGWVGVLLGSADEVLALQPASSWPRRIDIGVVGPHPKGSEVQFELRTFFSNHLGAIVEDPITGSFNASAAQWLISSGRAKAPYMAAQGTALGRRGRISIEQDETALWVGGRTETMFAHLS